MKLKMGSRARAVRMISKITLARNDGDGDGDGGGSFNVADRAFDPDD